MTPLDSGSLQYEPGSYRDPNGRVFYAGGEVCRGLNDHALRSWEAVRTKPFFRRWTDAGRIVRSERLAPSELDGLAAAQGWAGVLRHETIPFISYPYEWTFEMLRDAASLQLELLIDALDDGVTLKDATPYNIQWVGSRPVYIDIGSFEPIEPGEPWMGYRQFCQLFLYPLFLQAYKRVAFQPWLRGKIDGIEPEQCKNLMSLRDLFRPGVLTHVLLHAKLDASARGNTTSTRSALRRAGFQNEMIRANLNGLARIVRGLRWTSRASLWTGYATHNTYGDTGRAEKERFVREVVATRPWRLVWDLGANTGTYSSIAAENARYVVAMDSDQPAVDELYRALKTSGATSILPLVADIADPSPNLGWRCAERKGLVERGRPDLTLCLALVHHVALRSNIPLREFIDWLHGLGTSVVIEFVDRADPMVRALLGNKLEPYSDYDAALFERWLADKFDIARRTPLPGGTRTLYYAVAKTGRLS